MTRWIVLHSTLGVTVARNVGYKSIGHGFYLEDGTETDNKFWSNIGIFARAAVDNKQNPRTVPGILAANQETKDVTPLSLRVPIPPIPRCSGSPTAGTISSATWRPAPEPAAPPIGSSRS